MYACVHVYRKELQLLSEQMYCVPNLWQVNDSVSKISLVPLCVYSTFLSEDIEGSTVTIMNHLRTTEKVRYICGVFTTSGFFHRRVNRCTYVDLFVISGSLLCPGFIIVSCKCIDY